MGRLFGTDGVRGIANKELTPELAFNLGKAGAYVLKKNNDKPIVVIGKDTRVSGDMLESALLAGLCACGCDVVRLGVIPTPAIAYLTVFNHAAGLSDETHSFDAVVGELVEWTAFVITFLIWNRINFFVISDDIIF